MVGRVPKLYMDLVVLVQKKMSVPLIKYLVPPLTERPDIEMTTIIYQQMEFKGR
jgi:hypothetical protein